MNNILFIGINGNATSFIFGGKGETKSFPLLCRSYLKFSFFFLSLSSSEVVA